MSALTVFGIGLGSAITLLVAVWVIQLFTRNAGLVDVVWSVALGVIALEYALLGTGAVASRLFVAALAITWSLRLAGHLALRMRGQPEDSRYAAARAAWGAKANRYMLAFFVLQAVIAAVLSLPLLVIADMPQTPPVPIAVAALVVWFVSVVGEGTADAQLHAFKSDPANRGHVCRRGLWYYSRHPNYFFESLHWVTYVVLAIGAAFWWVTLIGPVLMAVLLLRISGIPTIENRDASKKRIGHDEYVRTTNAFIPWPPRP